ncbi:MAG: biopolymer transport protein ExbB/TolQ [Candidatus Deianiraeaceae bacterium]|jgi:biopolymer transport protein ExbB/TolQ
MLEFFFQFGKAGFILFICAFVISVITIERIYFLFIAYPQKNKDALLSGLLQTLDDEKQKPINIREAHVTQEVERVDALLSKGLILIRFISVISPMLGLFGTILGMIAIFGSISEANSPVTPALISEGLREALYTTALGLSIAMPSIGINVFFNSYINARIQTYVYILNEKNISIDYNHND